MKYMIRETYTAQRGKVPEDLEHLKVVIDFMKAGGITYHKLMVDLSGPLDTVYHEYEVDSLDQYFAGERGLYDNPDAPTQKLTDDVNAVTVSGNREIFEVLM